MAGDNPELRSKFIEITEAFSVLSKESKRKEYDFQRKTNALSGIESSYRMDYSKPESLDPKLVVAYENEMRRRWNTKLNDWMRGQGEYELERGHHVKPIPAVLEHSYVSQELVRHNTLLYAGLLAFSFAMAYIYADMYVISTCDRLCNSCLVFTAVIL